MHVMLFFMNTHVASYYHACMYVRSEIFFGIDWNAIDGSFIKGWVQNKRLEQPSHKFLRHIVIAIYIHSLLSLHLYSYTLVPPIEFFFIWLYCNYS